MKAFAAEHDIPWLEWERDPAIDPKTGYPYTFMSLDMPTKLALWASGPDLLLAQSRGLDPAAQLRPPTDSWPTYSGDLTGRRYSALKYIDKTNVKQLSFAWVARGFTEGSGATGRSSAAWGAPPSFRDFSVPPPKTKRTC